MTVCVCVLKVRFRRTSNIGLFAIGVRNRPLTDEQKANNREKSRVRSRVEHIFEFMEMSMNGMYIQSINIINP